MRKAAFSFQNIRALPQYPRTWDIGVRLLYGRKLRLFARLGSVKLVTFVKNGQPSNFIWPEAAAFRMFKLGNIDDCWYEQVIKGFIWPKTTAIRLFELSNLEEVGTNLENRHLI